jgi:hypothetical protein
MNRFRYLKNIARANIISSKQPLPMKDIDLRARMTQPKQINHEEDIWIPALDLDDPGDGEGD